ncbi:MAG: DNA methyltransferase [Egibacteraceae bacterium]
MELFTRISSNIGDVVLDPFCGSGTVPSVAKRLRRKYVGIEIDAHHHDTSVRRVNDTQSQRMIREFFPRKKKIDQFFSKPKDRS